MCEMTFGSIFADELLRLIVSVLLLSCSYVLKKILIDRKLWDVAFWAIFALFLFCVGIYGYIVRHIYLGNTFSYDGFISTAAFFTVCGLLFSKKRYVEFSNRLICKNTPIFLVSFFVFAMVYILTLKYNFGCGESYYDIIANLLQIVIYPLLLLFTAAAFLFRFTVVVSSLAVCIALFIVENVAFIVQILFVYDDAIVAEGVVLTLVSVVVALVSMMVLIKTSKQYKEIKKHDGISYR